MMNRGRLLTRILAIIGTLLVWFPVLMTILTAVIGSIAARRFRCDFLMPIELFPFAGFGVLLLFWAARRSRARWAPFAWGLGLMLLGMIGGQALAVATGLASGPTEPKGWPFLLVLSMLGVYTAALLKTGIAAIFLLRDLNKRPAAAASEAN